jgi:ribulose-phosphate 3-epimerase
MIRICPSILNANFEDLPNEIAKVAHSADLIHLDIMDGIFVPNTTFDLNWTKEIIDSSPLPVDLHLMISEADSKVFPYVKMNAVSISVHLEALTDPRATLRLIRENGKRAALAIKPATSIESVQPYLQDLDMILVMTVEPGLGGQKFIAEMLPKVTQARKWLIENGLDETWIQVDGGINETTIREACVAGADTFVAGSVVYKSPDPADMVTKLRSCAIRG